MTTIVAIADTHGFNNRVQLPDGDILIAAGDIMKYGGRDELKNFAKWAADYPHKHKIVIAGNHDFCFDKHPEESRQILRDHGIIYLQDQYTELEGLLFYGTPWTRTFGPFVFMLDEIDLAKKWSLMNTMPNVLITHGPPHGILDRTVDNERVGSDSLMNYLIKSKILHAERPDVHIFGHIHEGRGHYQVAGTNFYNASICDERYSPTNKPWIIEI